RLRIACWLSLVVVMSDEKLPGERRVPRGEPVKRGDIVLVREAIRTWYRIGRRRTWIATGLEQDDALARLGEPCRNRTAACTRTDHDVLTIGRSQIGFRRETRHRLNWRAADYRTTRSQIRKLLQNRISQRDESENSQTISIFAGYS